jgi:Telomere resolvase
MALTGRRPAEIFFSATFSLPPKKLPYPALIFEGQLKTRHAPGTSFEPYPIPVLAEPKKIIAELAKLRFLKTFASPDVRQHHHQPSTPQIRFGCLRLPGPTLETRPPAKRLRRYLLPPL